LLVQGTKLGPYEILAPLGAGGMGEVYRARDTRLGRDVAIKVLPESFARDPERLRRFEQEARTIAALNHPNLLAIHDVGEHGGTRYLVSELLDGENLRAVLNGGALPQRKALEYAVQIAQGLAAAHEKTAIHRDLKPENIFLTRDGRVKILDFGLAKLARPGGDTSEEATLGTAASPETSPGVVLGTVGYMSPEQVRGQAADHRSDIFALGTILYEMLSGRRAFRRDTSAETMTAILKEDPPELSNSALQVSPALDRIVHRCLEKSPELRFQSAKDLAFALEGISGTTGSATALRAVAAKKWPLPLPALLGVAAALAVGLALGGAVLVSRWWSPRREVLQFEINAPEKTVFNVRGISGPPVISPDGRTLAFVPLAEGPAGSRSLWLRSLDATEARKVAGSEEASYPFWSPASRDVGFFAGGKLKRYELSSGTLLTVCDVAEGRGGAWSESGLVIFGTRDGPLYKVSSAGGQPVQITSLDKSKNEASHRWPLFFPDQEHFFYLAQAPQSHGYMASLKSKERRMLENVETNVGLAEGRLFYVRNGELLAQPFDPARLEFTADATAVAERIQTDFQFSFAAFHVSGSAMVYQSGGVETGTRLVSVDRSGKETPLATESGVLYALALAPAGDRLLGQISKGSGGVSDIWLYNLARNTKTRLTFDQHSVNPVWSPDGGRVAFKLETSEGQELVIKSASGSGTEDVIFKTGKNFEPSSWSPDGRYIIGAAHPPEIWAVPVAGDHKPIVLLPSGHISGTFFFPVLSPDGKWLAYASNDSGMQELYVVPFHPESDVAADAQGKWQVSSGGGLAARWRADGKELYFTKPNGTTLLVAEVRAAGGHFETGRSMPLFDLPTHPYGEVFYAPARDGRHFYLTLFSQASVAPLTVTLNWKERLKK